METQTAAEPKTYYSRSKGLALHPAIGDRVIVQGEVKRIGEKIIEFQECDPEFGCFTTDDPQVIEFLEKRILKEGDVMSVEAYNNAILPDAQKIETLRNQNTEQSRLIEEQNRIIAELKRGQSKMPVPVKQ